MKKFFRLNKIRLIITAFLGLSLALAPVSSSFAFEPKSSSKKYRKAKVKNTFTPTENTTDATPLDTAEFNHQHYDCELGARLKISSPKDVIEASAIAMQWQGKQYTLNRVETTTGANRYEDSKSGLVWIHIPAKGMLMDSHKGRQLANECKSQS